MILTVADSEPLNCDGASVVRDGETLRIDVLSADEVVLTMSMGAESSGRLVNAIFMAVNSGRVESVDLSSEE